MQKGEFFVSSLWHYPLDDDNEEHEYMSEQRAKQQSDNTTVDVDTSGISHHSFPTRQQENSFSERPLRARHDHFSTTIPHDDSYSTSLFSSSQEVKDRSTSLNNSCRHDECGGGYWNTTQQESSEARVAAAPCAAPSPLPRPAPRGGARAVREEGTSTGIDQQGQGQLLWDTPRLSSLSQLQLDKNTAVDRQQASLIESEKANYLLRPRAPDYTSNCAANYGGGYTFSVGQYRSPTASPAGHAQDGEFGRGGWRPTPCVASSTALDELHVEERRVGVGARGSSSRSPSVVQEISISVSASRARSESTQQDEWGTSSSPHQQSYWETRSVENSNSRGPREEDRGADAISSLPYSVCMPKIDATARPTTVGSHSPQPPTVRDVRTDPYISFVLQKASQLERQALMREARAEAEGDFRVQTEQQQQQPSSNASLHLAVDGKESNYVYMEDSTDRRPPIAFNCDVRPTPRQIALYTEALKSCVVALETLEAAKVHVAANAHSNGNVFAADEEESLAGRALSNRSTGTCSSSSSSSSSSSLALRMINSKIKDIVEHCEALKGLILASSYSSSSSCGSGGGEHSAREEEEEEENKSDIELILKYQHDLKRVQGKLMAKENPNATLPQHESTLKCAQHETATRRRDNEREIRPLYDQHGTSSTTATASTLDASAVRSLPSAPSIRAPSLSLRDYRPQQHNEDGNYYDHAYYHCVDPCQRKAAVEVELQRQRWRKERQERLAAAKKTRDASDPTNFTPTLAQFTTGSTRCLPHCIALGMHALPHPPLRGVGGRPAASSSGGGGDEGNGVRTSFFTLYDLSSARERTIMAEILQSLRASKRGGEEKGPSFGLGSHHRLDFPSTLFADSTSCTSSKSTSSGGTETNPRIAQTIAKPSSLNIDASTHEEWFVGAGGMVSPADDDRQFRYRPRANPPQNNGSRLNGDSDSDESRYQPVSLVDGEDDQHGMPSPAARSSVEDRFSRALASYGAQTEERNKHEAVNQEYVSKETPPADKTGFKNGGVAPKNSDYLLRIKHRLEMERVAREGLLSKGKGKGTTNRAQTKSTSRSLSSNSRPTRVAKSPPPSRSTSAFSFASMNRRASSRLHEHVAPSSSTHAGAHEKKARAEAKSESDFCVREQRDVHSATPSHLTSARARSALGTGAPSKDPNLATTPRKVNKVISSSMKNEDTEGMTSNKKLVYMSSSVSKKDEDVNGRAARGSPWGGELRERETAGGGQKRQHQQLVSGGSRSPRNANMNTKLGLTTATYHLSEIQHSDTCTSSSSGVRGGYAMRDEPQEFLGGQGKRALLDDNDVHSALGTPNTTGRKSSAPSDESRRGHCGKSPAKKSPRDTNREGPKTTLGTWAPSKVNSFL